MASTGDLLPSCLNDPNFAVICAFLQKFSTKLNIVYPNFNDLQKMIENTDEVAEDLQSLIVKLLRKTRKTVHNGKWEHALAKFCYSYSAQDAWEIERFGFKKANLPVKLRVIKEVLESQFERNLKFKTELNLLSAEELRSQPLGKDKYGNAYWSTMDVDLNLRIYQEHLDEDIWKICAHSRDDLAKLIACLKGNELVMPSLVGLVDEDSNSMPQEKLDAFKNGNDDSDEQNKDPTKSVAELSKPVTKVGEEAEEEEEDDDDDEDLSEEESESNISEMDVSSQDASECSAPIAEPKKPPVLEKLPPIVITKAGANKSLAKSNESNAAKLPAKRRIESESGDESASKVPKLQRPTLLSKNQTIKTNKFAHLSQGDDDDHGESSNSSDEEEEEEEEEQEEEEDEEDGSGTEDETDNDEVGEEIVEPVMYVKGAGSGAANKGTFLDLMNFGAESEVGEAIEEEVMFVVGNGSGAENDVGNTDNKPSSDKPMFFFGQAGCLKLSPIKQSNLPKVDSSIENNVKTNNLFKDVPTVVDGGHSSGSPNDELELNSKNATESEGKSDTTNEAVVSVQPTEQCSVESSQSENKSDATNEPEVIESVQAIEKANAASESQQANETSSDVKSEEKEVPNETLSSPGATVPTATENEESSLQNQLVSAVDTKGPEREPEPEKIKSIVPASPEKDKPATETVASIVPTLTTKMEEAAAETSKPIELAANCSEIKDCAPCNDELAVPISTDTDGCVSEKVEPAESPLSKKDERAASDADDLRPNIPSNEIPAETPEATAADRSTESPPSSNQLNATSHQSITQEISETTSKDESDDVNSEIASDVAAADQPITSKENDESHEVLPEPSATDDTESLNVNLIESKPSSKDIDTVPESKTENLSECAVKSNETVSNELDCDKETVPNDDTTSELPSNVDERAASSLKLNEIEGTSEVNELLHPSDASKTPDTLESNKVLSVAEDENAQSTLEENVSSKEPKETIASSAPEELAVSVSEAAPSLNKDAEVEAANQEEPAPETNSSDSKVPSLIIDSRSCSNDPQRTEASMSPPPPATAVDDKEVLTNEVGLAPTENLSKHVELLHQTSLSNTEPEDVLGITSVPENFSTLTATDQSDEIVSEPVIDHLTPDVTSISTPSFDDQDHRTSDSILNDEVEPMEIPPADISIKEIGKFQIFNRKIDEERTPEQKDDVTSTPKLQYEGSEETETPLVLTRPAMSEVPLTVTDTPSSIDSAKDPKSSESASTSRMVETADKQPEVADPLQINSPAGEIVNSKPDSLTQFPMSFKNTQINNRKRPLVTKKDFDTDESSSEISEEEVEVKRQKTKPKFSHLAARKNAEIKRKATQIDCSTDEDEPVNKAHLKTISTELLTIENAVKQKKAMNEKTPNKMIKTDDPATSTQVVRNVTVAPPPVVHRETVVEEGKLEPLCLTTSKTVPKVETSANLPTEKMDISADLRPTTAVAIIPTAVLDKAKESLPPIVPIETKPVEVLESKIKPEEVETKPKEGAKVQPELLANKGAISKDEKVTEKEQKMEVDEEKSNDEIKSKTKVQSNPVPKDEAIDTQTIQKKVTATKEDPLEQKIAKVEEKSLIEEKTTAGKDKQETSRAADLKTTSDADKTKVEVKVSKPGPKSKKAAAVAAQTVTDVPSITPSSAPTDVPKEPETIQTTTTITRTRTTRALAANQPSTEPTVPEPIPKSAPSSRKATPPPPAAKPTPAKPAPKAAAKAKPPPKPKAQKKQAATKEPAAAAAKTVKESDVPDTKSEAPRKRKLMGLVFDDSAIISTNDGEAPVRQSRRIAQIKIKEEAERRKEEEEALKQMKAASDKKKKVVDETYTVKSESSASEDDSEQKLELKKKGKKKAKGANPWQTDSDHEETDISEEEHYESDHKLVFFKSDHEFSPESDIEDESQIVQTKRARTAVKHDDEHEIIDDGYACQKCNKHDHPEWILLCDKCDKGYHCSCLVPMLFIIPEGDWFCPLCQQDKLIETLESQLQNLDRDLKEKELEEIRRQRAAFTSVNVANVLPDEPDEPEYQKPKTARKRPTTSRRRRKNDNSDRSDGSSSSSSGSSRSGKSGSSSSSSNSSDDEPIYKLRKRRQVNVSYRFNEYDDLINSAIKKEMDTAEGAGNLGRGKDISTIIEADKEEKRIKRMGDDDDDDNEDDAKDVSGKTNDDETKSEEPGATEKKAKSETKSKASASDSDSEPIRKVQKRPLVPKSRKKNRKLNSLDIESEDDDGSDDDFRTSSFSEDEEDENFSGESDSDSSLEVYRRKKGKKGKRETRRSVRSRRKRYDDAFINDSDGDDDDVPIVTRKKKKKKEDSDFSEFNGESTDEEAEEDVDSEDLCDSTDSNDSDRGWRSKKSKKAKPKRPPPRPPTDSTPKPVPKKKVKKVEDAAFRAGIPKSKGKSISDESEDDDVQTKSRRTRGKKLTYLNLLDEFESSDSDGIKPGVKRPDTPPEERAAFIKKQEEIKRMLAEKNTVAAAALAAPKLTGSTPEKARRPAPVDSLSTIPRSIIQNAKALDPDYKRGKDSDDTDGFDDDLPDDFDAEGMDEEEIAKMMEEEDFAQQQLKAVGERVRKMKEAEMLLNKKKEAPKVTETSVIVPTAAPPVVVPTTPTNIPTHLATPPSVVVSPSSFSPRPAMPLSHLIRPPHSSPLSPGNVQHMQPHPVHHPQHSPLASQHLPMHPHLPPPHGPHHINALNTAHPSHQMVRGPPHHMLHPGQHPMQHFSPLQRHPMQLTQAPHISPNSQMAHRPLHPSIRSHHPLQMHPPPPQMQSHAPPPPSMVIDYPGDAKMMKLTKSGVEPKKRGRKSKAELQAIEQAKVISAPDPSTSMGPSLGPPLLQHPPTTQEPIIPTTVLAVQNTRLMDPSELGPPGAGAPEVKKRGRRKKFTPLRESLNKPVDGAPSPATGLEQKTNPILAERLGIHDNRNSLSIATPPQLFSPGSVGQPSVITRLPRPPLASPYGGVGQSTRLPFSPHGPPPPLTSSPATSSNGGPSPNHYVQSSPHFRSPAPAHFSGPSSNYQLIHRSGLQSIEGASSTPQDYSTPPVPIPYASSYGTYYPPHHPANVEHRSQPPPSSQQQQPPPPPQPPTTTAPATAAPATSTFEQFDNAKNTPPHDRTTPNAYQQSPPTDEPPASTSEFSGLVSYFSSQQDDLET